jgi:putative transposase
MYWKGSHCVYDCRYHIVWITKYRRKCLDEEIQRELKEILEKVSEEMYVKVLKMGMEEDHVHLYVSIPPSQPLPMVVQRYKGVSSKEIRKAHGKRLKEYYWKPVLWAVGYFVASVGEVNDEIIRRYVENQGKKDIDDEYIPLEATGL